MKSITRQWVQGSLLITLIVLAIAEGIFIFFTISSNYDSVHNALQTRCETLIAQLNASDSDNPVNRDIILRRMIEQFTEKDKFELSLLNANGEILVTSSGYVHSKSQTPYEDYMQALQTNDIGASIYNNDTGEKVMSLTMLLQNTAEFSAVRMSTSLTLVDESIITLVLFSLAIAALVLLFSFWSGMFFIRGIVRPIGDIENTASKIAKGNFNIRVDTPNKTSEMSRLALTINNMAQELEITEKMKNDFISSVSHELRTPLTSIKGWGETLLSHKDDKSESYERGLKVICSETDRLYDMVEELLDFSRLQNGIVLNCNMLDLVAEVTDSILTVEQRVLNEGMSILYEEPLEPIPVYADDSRLRQVFINILDNAIKYSYKGGVITVTLANDDSKAYISVRDEGMGITPDDLEYVKTKFYKGKGARRGNGIGLAVVEEIMSAHSGSIDIDSEYKKGTVVTLCLPLYNKKSKETYT